MRIYRYQVAGDGSFPFALLAEDQAWPASHAEAEKIMLACPTVAPRQFIMLASYAHPNVNRWKEEKWPVRRVDA